MGKIHFYPEEEKSSRLYYGLDSVLDFILHVLRDLPLNSGLWFEIENSTDTESKQLEIPQNAYRAVLEWHGRVNWRTEEVTPVDDEEPANRPERLNLAGEGSEPIELRDWIWTDCFEMEWQQQTTMLSIQL
ncbi:unnamed protein product [Cuscuta campestris]|uniref:Uncharacterized protein n=1 Tax=Cuscuta campestris TaxID=132261 RepID=A0A484KQC3_9ASTE|nr:unnamed protein product [Cuscuta campestris]